jgi:hypothetical protein
MSRTEIACVITMCAAMLAGLAMFIAERQAHLVSKAMTQQHESACAEQGLPSDACCRVGRAWVCPLVMKEPND